MRRYDLLDTPPDGAFDRVAAIAANLFSVPISIISLVDHDRIWFKSHHGLEVQQIGRDPGLCASAIWQAEPWILTDARIDPRSLSNPLVAGEFGLRFYAGVPLRTSDGFNLGTLCVIDQEPRPITERQIANLQDLALVVMDQMELRLSARRAIGELSESIAQKEAALRRTEMMAKEVDHRVKNSLQLVSSFLRLQARALGNTEAADQLLSAGGRVAAVARVHQHIYLRDGMENAGCKEYLDRLCADLADTSPGLSEAGIIVDASDDVIQTQRLVSVGLIVNELVTNALKQGASRIDVRFHRVVGGHALSVTDNGPGLPPGFDLEATAGLGMKVVSALARQEGGELRFAVADGGRGAVFTILLPETIPSLLD